jgi:hypothetical protein
MTIYSASEQVEFVNGTYIKVFRHDIPAYEWEKEVRLLFREFSKEGGP